MGKTRSRLRKFLFLLNVILWVLLLGFLVVACTPLTRLLLGPLTVQEEVREADLIVVLGGGVNRGRYLNLVSSHRLVRGVQLYFDGKAPKILLSGGIVGKASVSEAAVLAQEARRLRVPAEAIVQEKTGRNTREQAVEVKKIADSLRAKSILLVTSFSHLKRSVMAFEQVGLKVYPVSADPVEKYADSAPDRLALFPRLAHEYAGMVYYKGRGWI